MWIRSGDIRDQSVKLYEIFIVLYSMPAAGRLTTQLAYRQYYSIVG